MKHMYDSVSFTGRLNQLFSESRLTMQKFAEQCGVSRAAMQNYLNGTREKPDAEIVCKICKACFVTADWLLGLSNVRTTSADVQNAINVLGLSEDAIKEIIDPSSIGRCKEALSHLLVQDGFLPLLMQYEDYLMLAEIENQSTDEDKPLELDLEKHTVTLPISLTLDYQRQMIMDTISSICKAEIIPEASYSADEGWTYPRREALQKRKGESKTETP